jgi:hypothetical protein
MVCGAHVHHRLAEGEISTLPPMFYIELAVTDIDTPEDRPCGSHRRNAQASSVAEWLRRRPVAGCEMRVADEEQFGLCARLVEPAQLGKACRQETA